MVPKCPFCNKHKFAYSTEGEFKLIFCSNCGAVLGAFNNLS